MNSVVLPGTEIQATQLGFGCARLFRVPSSSQRQRLLHAAFDAGIRHFDVARMYGLGAAEAELGRFAAGRRDQLTIATKFGIEPNASAQRWRAFQNVARWTMARVPPLRRLAAAKSAGLYQPRDFSPAAAARSLETSLRELQTDYVDLFLLHEPTPNDAVGDCLASWLETARQAGKIRTHGLAGPLSDISAVAEREPALAVVLQCPYAALNSDRPRAKLDARHLIVTYGVFSETLTKVTDALPSNAETCARWPALSAAMLDDPDVIGRALLRHGLKTNRRGITLFSTSQLSRVTAYAAAANSIDACEACDREMAEIVAKTMGPGEAETSRLIAR
jgi:D-threo-aldose 1-dehydrogenase